MTLASHSGLEVEYRVTAIFKLLKTTHSSWLSNVPLRGEFAGVFPSPTA